MRANNHDGDGAGSEAEWVQRWSLAYQDCLEKWRVHDERLATFLWLRFEKSFLVRQIAVREGYSVGQANSLNSKALGVLGACDGIEAGAVFHRELTGQRLRRGE